MAGPTATVELILKLNTFILNGPSERNLARTAVLQDIVQAWETNKEVTLTTEDSFTLEQDVGSHESPDDLSEDYRYMDTDDMLLRDDEPVTSHSSLPGQLVTKPWYCVLCGYDYWPAGSCKDCPNCPRKSTKLKRKARFPKEERSSPNVRADTGSRSDGVQTASDLTQYPRQSGNDRDDTRTPNQRNLTQNIGGAKFQTHPHKRRQNKSRGDSQMTEAGPSGQTSRHAKMQRSKHQLSKSVRTIHSPHKRVQHPVRWSQPGHLSHDSRHISIPNVPIQTTSYNAMSVAGGLGAAGGESPKYMTNRMHENQRQDGSQEMQDGAGGASFQNSAMGKAGSENFTCNKCQESFADINDLCEHFKVHTNTTPARVIPNVLRCDKCNQAFSTQTKLRHHQALNHQTATSHRYNSRPKAEPGHHLTPRKHTTPRGRFLGECPHCMKNFDSKRLLEDHIRIHTGEKPFQCEHCEEDFRTKAYLRNHIKKHHDVPSTTEAAERPQSSLANTELSNAAQSSIQVTINVPSNVPPNK